jgi:Ca2+-binding EF-hand superfamily protein
MSKKHDNKNDLPMSNSSSDMSMKNDKKMSCCNNKSKKESVETDKKDKGCSMCMKGKKDNQKVSFNKLDNNSDGKISISEYLDNPNQEFDALDSNRDGFLTKDELNSKESSDPHAHH